MKDTVLAQLAALKGAPAPGVAGLVAGATAMAAGEYVSVSSQADKMPRARAIFRFLTNSNLVACITGKCPALCPPELDLAQKDEATLG